MNATAWKFTVNIIIIIGVDSTKIVHNRADKDPVDLTKINMLFSRVISK